jgi:ribosomal protein L31E
MPRRPLSAIRAFETARGFQVGRIWIIVAARSGDETEIGPAKQLADEAIKDIRRAMRRHFSAEELTLTRLCADSPK